MCVRTWGSPNSPVVICWHGFARTGTDFAVLATALSDRFYVVCPDTPGRGLSAWLPSDAYHFSTYQSLALDLIQQFAKNRPVHWVGTSMGGVIGMMLAAHPTQRRFIDRLVLNDIGPEVPDEALERIREYTSQSPCFADYPSARAYLEEIYSPFGELSEPEWQTMQMHSWRRDSDGSLVPHYDPAILARFGEPQNKPLAWTLFSSIMSPMLVIRGMESDILTEAIAQRMAESALRVSRLDVPNAGHAPFLNTGSQVSEIKRFLS